MSAVEAEATLANSEAAASEKSQKVDVAELKELGNKAFGDEDFAAADRYYTQCIALDPSQHSLWSNRAAARTKLDMLDGALSDAEECIRLKPDWVKGYHRKALALKASGKITDAYDAYSLALSTCAKDAWLKREAKRCEKEMRKAHLEQPVESAEEMEKIFAHMDDIWTRLSTLAYFWNASSLAERQTIFARFLTIISDGKTPTSIADYEQDQMIDLPTENYENAGKLPVKGWIDLFASLDTQSKVVLYENMWNSTSAEEKEVIFKDLQHFLLRPLMERRMNLNPTSDEIADEE